VVLTHWAPIDSLRVCPLVKAIAPRQMSKDCLLNVTYFHFLSFRFDVTRARLELVLLSLPSYFLATLLSLPVPHYFNILELFQHPLECSVPERLEIFLLGVPSRKPVPIPC
jgi:hypothetical protein